ncbi:hypothetical protein [Streptomyces sp. NRRL F-7442]|uniref:hypothetical protein n=1 Tax=Streptomyces sp. NRRL F-7442 TaxID=1519498 RepID=UPI000ACD5146|nr:hypothetical protein [Streptomyces sp. NRRL F-7442]
MARNWVCTGGSDASDVPASASLAIGLNAIDAEENASQSASAPRMTSYRVSA